MAKKQITVVMYVAAAGPDFNYSVGQKVAIDADLAEEWIKAGVARPAEEEGRTRQTRAFVVEEETLNATERAVGAREQGRK